MTIYIVFTAGLENMITVLKLLSFETSYGRTINVCEQIEDPVMFGKALLQDETGNVVYDVISREVHPSARNFALFIHWLEMGRRTWKDLISVLRETGLNSLAYEIEDAIRDRC